jgi:hypothetical protein
MEINFEYEIAENIPSESRMFVIYTVSDVSWGAWVNIEEGLSESEILDKIVQSFPHYRWNHAENEIAKSLVGRKGSSVYVELIQEPSTISAYTEAVLQRNSLLAISDWTVLADSPLSAEQIQDFKTYRQNLRDITTLEDFPNNIVWPAKPIIL